jgi:anaerobic carbon-monoxide dehydrogenase iron sulfur subunit
MRKQIEITADLCNGCRMCNSACSLQKIGKFNKFATGVWITSDHATGKNYPSVCRQCANPVCVRACPAERAWRGKPAVSHGNCPTCGEPVSCSKCGWKGDTTFSPPIWKDPETGIVYLDSTKESCLGCGECMRACPFGAIRVVPEDNRLVKCDLCGGGEPQCVKTCPKEALKFVEVTKSRIKSKSA